MPEPSRSRGRPKDALCSMLVTAGGAAAQTGCAISGSLWCFSAGDPQECGTPGAESGGNSRHNLGSAYRPTIKRGNTAIKRIESRLLISLIPFVHEWPWVSVKYLPNLVAIVSVLFLKTVDNSRVTVKLFCTLKGKTKNTQLRREDF